MRFVEEPSLKNPEKIRQILLTSREEAEVMFEVITKALRYFPLNDETRSTHGRMSTIKKSLSQYLGHSKERVRKFPKTVQCPKCASTVRGERGLPNHLVDKHGKESL